MSNLRQLLGMKPATPQRTEHEIMARRMIRQLTLMGYGPYDVWLIVNEMEQISLDAQEHPDLFPQNQRPPNVRVTR